VSRSRDGVDLEVVLSRNVGRGERSVAVVRAGAALLAMLQLLIRDYDEVAAFDLRPWIVIVGLMAGVLFSAWTLRYRGGLSRRMLWTSAVVDMLVISVAVFPTMFWPRDNYPGQLHLPGLAFYGLAIGISGLRLDRKLVRLSIVSNTLGAILLVVLDLTLNGRHPDLDMGEPLLWLAFGAAAAGLGDAITVRTLRLVTEAAQSVTQKERARQALGVYVSETVAESVLGEGEILELGGARREVVVLFSDLRGFTAYSDSLSPERLVTEINAYLDRMVEVIREEGGVVDKYIGDAIMVVFGLPESKEDDALRAVRCAARMQEALTEHNRERAQHDLPPLAQGIGVHKGHAVAGNIGSADRLQYTVMGAAVNLASRLESATKAEGVPVLLSEAVVQGIDSTGPETPALVHHGQLSLRGHTGQVSVYTLAKDQGAEG
jgi:class 3 adenylate cyclase